MRIGVAWEPGANANYRAVDPMNAMGRRGHEIVGPPDDQGELDLRRLLSCDVVHVYRRANDDARRVLTELNRAGVPFTYDNDDDLSEMPKESATYKTHGGLNAQRIFGMTVKAACMARVVTTPSEVLADKYVRGGAKRVEIIENQVNPAWPRPRMAHEGIVIGWVAAHEHRADAERLRIREVLLDVLAKHPDVRVECIGVNLGLPERYKHDAWVPLPQLPARMGGWDIGIAPMVDIPWNRARSDIKLKEYAASEVVWLASPVGAYRALGEKQGGRLVADSDWLSALDAVIAGNRARRKLAANGRKWAKRQTIDAVADRWERLLQDAADR